MMDILVCFVLIRDILIDDFLKYKLYGCYKFMIFCILFCNVVGYSIYQFIVMFVLIFKGGDLFDIVDGFDFNIFCMLIQYSFIVFIIFVFMQLFNEVNVRMLQERNVFNGIYKNCVFFIIWFG